VKLAASEGASWHEAAGDPQRRLPTTRGGGSGAYRRDRPQRSDRRPARCDTRCLSCAACVYPRPALRASQAEDRGFESHRPLTEKGKEAGLFRVWEPTVGGATGAEMVSNGEDCFGRLSLKRRLSPRPVFSPAWEEAGILRRTYNLSTNCEAAAEGVGCMAVPRSPLITPKRST
jgi:hypothetical protein